MIVPIGLVIAFILVVIFTKRNTRKCRWREKRRLDKNGEKYYICMTCGAEVFTDTGNPPATCKIEMQPPKL